jgi:hypothetical protein
MAFEADYSDFATPTDFDDDAGSPADYGLTQDDFDFASAMGRSSATGGSDADRQAIANYLAQPQVGRTRSNIIDSPFYDPEFASAFNISRGLNPGGIQSLISTPTYLQPQLTGQRVDKRGEPVRYYSPVERFMQETLPPVIESIRNVSPTGIITNLIDRGLDVYNKGKEVIKDAFEPEKKTDVGIMENMDRAGLTDAGRAILAGMQNTNRNLPPVTTAFNLRDVLTSPGMINRGLDFVQPYLQQVVPQGVDVDTKPVIDREKGTVTPQIQFRIPIEDNTLGLGGLFRNLG